MKKKKKKVQKQKEKLKINVNNINDIGKSNNLGNNNISTNYLMNNNNNKEKMDIKKIIYNSLYIFILNQGKKNSNKEEKIIFHFLKR